MRIIRCAAFAFVLAGAMAQPSFAWGLRGHEIIGDAAVAHLPATLPQWLRSDDAKAEIVYLQTEEDRLKVGQSDERAWFREWSTDHYVDVDDNGRIGGSVALNALPETRDDYSKALYYGTSPIDPYSVGFLPYAILEGYEQVRTDFALERFAEELGLLDAIDIAGSVTHEELIAYYAASDVFVCLSNHEGFCVPLLEAMYHQLPIVAHTNTAVPETIEGAGLVLPDKDPARVAAAIHRVVEDARLRAALAQAASERVSSFALPRVQEGFATALEGAFAA